MPRTHIWKSSMLFKHFAWLLSLTFCLRSSEGSSKLENGKYLLILLLKYLLHLLLKSWELKKFWRTVFLYKSSMLSGMKYKLQNELGIKIYSFSQEYIIKTWHLQVCLFFLKYFMVPRDYFRANFKITLKNEGAL